MTISYSGNFFKLLSRWKGSIWKATWKELSVFLILYYSIRVLYHQILGVENQKVMAHLVREFDSYTERIPLTFLLGFYVAAVVKRWWEQFNYVTWPDDVLNCTLYIIPATDTRSRIIRQMIARYLNLTAALSWREISIKVRKRFPTVEHLIAAGLITDEELLIYYRTPPNIRWSLPVFWVQDLMSKYAAEHQSPPPLISTWIRLLYDYRTGFKMLHCYDWVCIPLVYTQVAALATYGYFILCLIGRQFNPVQFSTLILADSVGAVLNGTITSDGTLSHDQQKIKSYSEHHLNSDPYRQVDYLIPIFTVLEFIFYIGWFKVGQDLMRPFEEDDDDFELNYILDRNIQVSVAMVNGLTEAPTIKEHSMWQGHDLPVIDTKVSSREQYHPPKMHANVNLKDGDAELVVEPLMRKVLDGKHTFRYF